MSKPPSGPCYLTAVLFVSLVLVLPSAPIGWVLAPTELFLALCSLLELIDSIYIRVSLLCCHGFNKVSLTPNTVSNESDALIEPQIIN